MHTITDCLDYIFSFVLAFRCDPSNSMKIICIPHLFSAMNVNTSCKPSIYLYQNLTLSCWHWNIHSLLGSWTVKHLANTWCPMFDTGFPFEWQELVLIEHSDAVIFDPIKLSTCQPVMYHRAVLSMISQYKHAWWCSSSCCTCGNGCTCVSVFVSRSDHCSAEGVCGVGSHAARTPRWELSEEAAFHPLPVARFEPPEHSGRLPEV